MSDANAERGERPLMLAGTAYKLRPSFEAIVAIEEKTKRELILLLQDSATGGLGLTPLGIVLAELVKAGAKDELTKHVSPKELAMLAYEQGLPSVLPTVTLCLSGAVNGGRDRSGEVKAPAAARDHVKAAGAE